MRRNLREARQLRVTATAAGNCERYAADPVGYARDVLKVSLTADQSAILVALLLPPYRVKARAGHSIGKTFIAAVAANWWFDTRNPGVVITTAPTLRDVVDLLWTEIRLQRQRAGLSMPFIGPAAPEMRTSEEHWAKGYTARKGESFQGRHRLRMMFLFDEDEGIEDGYWLTTNTMFTPDGDHAWLAIGNPTTTTSQSYREESLVGPDGSPKWNLFTLSCLNHPNIAAGLTGSPVPVPGAVTVDQVDGYVAEWCTRVAPDDRQPGDFEWRPGSGNYYRPGPAFEGRVLGVRPTRSTDAVWGEADFSMALRVVPFDTIPFPELGVDVARFGDDMSVIHGRRGTTSVHHESGNGWDTTQTTGRTREAACQLAADWNRDNAHRIGTPLPDSIERVLPLQPEKVVIRVDDDGVGGGVVDQLRAAGFTVVAVNAGVKSNRPDDHPNRRSEMWFSTVKLARQGGVSFARLPRDVQQRLQQQFLAPKYALDAAGRRVVEPKQETKKRLHRSPDDADAVNLAYSSYSASGGPSVVHRPPSPTVAGHPMHGTGPGGTDWATGRGLLGLGVR